MTFMQDQGNLKWYKMLEVRDAYEHGRYEKNVD